MTIQPAEYLTVRPSRNNSGMWVICREDGTAVRNPRARLAKYDENGSCYFATEALALAAIPEWRTIADDLSSERAPKPTGRMGRVVAVKTLQEEIAAQRKWQAKRDRDPWHGFHPCSGAHCMCKPTPQAFRTPSPELLAMQAGKPAYGQRNV